MRPQELRELLLLLSDGRLQSAKAESAMQRALLALEDPETYVINYPDDEWVVDGCDLSTNTEGSIRLLHWILQQELAEWLVSGSSIHVIAEKIVDRLNEMGIPIADPPQHLLTMQECRAHLTNALATQPKSPESKAVLQMEFGKGVGFLIVTAMQVPAIFEISSRIGLRISAW